MLFASQRAVFSSRHSQFFTVGVEGGVPAGRCRSPPATWGRSRPTGSSWPTRRWASGFASGRTIGAAPRRGSGCSSSPTSRTWRSPSPPAAATTPSPCGSARPSISSPIATASSISTRTTQRPRTSSGAPSTRDFPIESASAGAGKVIYEQAGYLHVFDPGASQSTRLKIGVAADLAETRPRRVSNVKAIRSADISPTGQARRAGVPRRDRHRAGQEGRPAQPHRDARRPRALARLVARRQVDRLLLRRLGRVRPARPSPGRQGRAARPTRSRGRASTSGPSGRPTARRSPSSTTARTLSWIDLGSGAVKRVAAEPVYSPIKTLSSSWSPDSEVAGLHADQQGRVPDRSGSIRSTRTSRIPLTDGLAEAGEPVFDAGGKYLYFLASTDAGPVKNWFDQSFTDMPLTLSAYLVTLQKATPNPLLKESDEETAEGRTRRRTRPKDSGAKKEIEGAGEEDQGGGKTDRPPRPQDKKDDAAARRQARRHRPGRDRRRIVALPIEPGLISGPGRRAARGRSTTSAGPRRGRAQVEEGPGEAVAPPVRPQDARGGDPGRGHRRLPPLRRSQEDPLPRRRGRAGSSTRASSTRATAPWPRSRAISVPIEPRAEWAQIFREAWRINRDYFYAPNMHGADWDAVRREIRGPAAPPGHPRRPEPRDPRDAQRAGRGPQLSRAAASGCTSPSRCRSGCSGPTTRLPRAASGSRRSTAGPTGIPSLRAPLAAPGVDVKPGDFLLAVDGKEVKADGEVYRVLRGHRRQAGRAQGRPQGRRHRRPHRRRRADRRRGRAAEPRLGRGQPPQGPRANQGTRRLRLRAQHGRTRATPTSSATSSPRPTRRRSSSTSGSTAAARWPTTTSSSCAGRWSATGRRATASRSARPMPRSWAPRS